MSVESDDFDSALVALRPRLMRFARGLTGSAADADDLVQNTLERALARRTQWSEGTRLDSWVFRIAQSIRLNQVAAAKVRQRHAVSESHTEAAYFDGQRAMESRYSLERVQQVILTLPEEQRVALMLVSIEGFSYQEASSVIGVPVGTLTSRLARARMAVRDAIYGDDGQTRPSVRSGV